MEHHVSFFDHGVTYLEGKYKLVGVPTTKKNALQKNATYSCILQETHPPPPASKPQNIQLPIMIGSVLDPDRSFYDDRNIVGYFIINGNVRVMPFDEKPVANTPFCFSNGKISLWLSKPTAPWDRHYVMIDVNNQPPTITGTFSKNDTLRLCTELFEKIPELSGLRPLIDGGSKRISSSQLAKITKLKIEKSTLEGIIPIIPDILLKLNEGIRDNRNDIKNLRLVSTDWILGKFLVELEESKKLTKKFSIYQVIVRRIVQSGEFVDLENENPSHVLDTLARVRRSHMSHGTMSMRELDDSHMGVYCCIRNTEGPNIGLTVALTSEVKINPKDGTMTPGESLFCNKALELPFKYHLPTTRASLGLKHMLQAGSLSHNQKPIVYSSEITETANQESAGCGVNAIVAILPFGSNMEDAFAVSQTFAESGALDSVHIQRTLVEKSTKEEWDKIPELGQYIPNKGIIINKRDEEGKICPFKLKWGDGFVKSVELITPNKIKIIIETLHKLQVGDKISSRSGTKGVIGEIVPADKLPYTADGITPDIILNPHAFPSRLTASALFESLAGKHASVVGKTSCSDKLDNLDDIVKTDSLNGVSAKEIMYDGKTGIQLTNPVNIGIILFYALRHYSSKKIRSRNLGPVNKLTLQPVQNGEKKGLRLGEMENDICDLSRAVGTKNELTIKNCDPSKIEVCKVCGIIQPPPRHKHQGTTVEVDIPHTTRLFLLEALGQEYFPKIEIGPV